MHEDAPSTRTAYAEVPARVEYALTPLGGGLHEIVTSLIGWAADHHDEIRVNRDRAAATGSWDRNRPGPSTPRPWSRPEADGNDEHDANSDGPRGPLRHRSASRRSGARAARSRCPLADHARRMPLPADPSPTPLPHYLLTCKLEV
ncbi:winged helix-turn-helix transcriptional regulator [Streptomyces sp. 1222.2]|uniref:winged helix-turn-helix transcriptional regulator n=1 Tax=Streptomyces sp. 1222.2 TaxID=1938833 RepID=UPI00359C82EF